MSQLFYVLINTVYYLLWGLEIVMLISAVTSWLPIGDDHPLLDFFDTVTDMVSSPFRVLLERFDALKELPVDLSVILTYFCVVILINLLDLIK